MDLMTLAGQCDNGYACVYQNNLSWSSPTTPLPSEAHPRIVFERLFGDGGTSAERRVALRRRASLLDSVMDEFTQLNHQLGPADRAASPAILTRSARWNAGFSEPRRARATTRCRTSSVRAACRPPTPSTPA